MRSVLREEKPRRTRGFTILELLVSISIFMIVATLLYGMVANGMSMWKRGEETREIYEFGQAVLSRISEDLRNVHPGGIPLFASPDVRLIGDLDQSQRSRIRFVRTAGASVRAFTRLAGTKPGPSAYLDFRDDAQELEEGLLKPTGGMIESLYAVLPSSEVARLQASNSTAPPTSSAPSSAGPTRVSSTMVLVRGIRSPIGGPKSLLRRDDLDDPLELLEVAQPLAYGVLFFGLEYVGHGVGNLDFSSSETYWDSTRGVLPQFSLALGPGSEEDTRDDVFPRAIRVTLVLERPGSQARTTFLRRPLGTADKMLAVADVSLLPREDREGLIKVGEEWIEIGAIRGREAIIVDRGVRGTSVTSHPSRSPVHVGVTFRKVVPMGSYRESVVE